MTATKTARDPARIKPKNRAVPGQSALLLQHILFTLPRVQSYWLPGGMKRNAALIRYCAKWHWPAWRKRLFHCQGGAVFAIAARGHEKAVLRIIVAYQTLCDYLDNLCDRAGSTDGEAFRHLHNSLLTALTPGSACEDYYLFYPHKQDGGYINKLVAECQTQIETLSNYRRVQERLWELANWYIELQVRKHLHPEIREEQLIGWAKELCSRYPGVRWQEIAAAAGSTLALFALLGWPAVKNWTMPSYSGPGRLTFLDLRPAHPAGLFVIDREEDRQGGDLNLPLLPR